MKKLENIRKIGDIFRSTWLESIQGDKYKFMFVFDSMAGPVVLSARGHCKEEVLLDIDQQAGKWIKDWFGEV